MKLGYLYMRLGFAFEHVDVKLSPPFLNTPLKVIEQGIVTEEEISRALGVEIDFIQNALEHLSSMQLIKGSITNTPSSLMCFSLTTKGQEAINKSLLASFESTMLLQVDGITGKYAGIIRDLFLFEGSDLKKQGILPLHSSPKVRPSTESLNNDLPALLDIYRAQQDEIDNTDQLVEIIDVLSLRLKYKLIDIMVFRNCQDGEIKIKVLEGYELVPDYEIRLSERERNGSRVIPDDLLVKQVDFTPSSINKDLHIDIAVLQNKQTMIEELEEERSNLTEQTTIQEIQDQETITSRTERIEELETEIERLKKQQSSTRLITASEHPTILRHALTIAKELVLIISPWINRHVVDEGMVKLIQTAIERDVWIVLGYGMPLREKDVKDNYIDEWVSTQFKSIQSRPNGKKLFYAWLGTHEKILVCDRIFTVVSSFNWFSYRGDKGFRRETGTYSEDPRIVSQAIHRVLSGFKTLPASFPLSSSDLETD